MYIDIYTFIYLSRPYIRNLNTFLENNMHASFTVFNNRADVAIILTMMLKILFHYKIRRHIKY